MYSAKQPFINWIKPFITHSEIGLTLELREPEVFFLVNFLDSKRINCLIVSVTKDGMRVVILSLFGNICYDVNSLSALMALGDPSTIAMLPNVVVCAVVDRAGSCQPQISKHKHLAPSTNKKQKRSGREDFSTPAQRHGTTSPVLSESWTNRCPFSRKT